MKKKVLFMISSLILSGTINSQTLTNGSFNGSTGNIGTVGVAAPWIKGCAYNTTSNTGINSPEVIVDQSNNFLQLKGAYNPYSGGATFNMESAAQWVGTIPSGIYTINFDARNYLQTPGNPGVRLAVTLKNYSGCSWNTTHQNPQELQQVVPIQLVYNFNNYSVTFCVPPNLNNELSYLEFGVIQQQSTSTFCNGIIDLDNITFTNTSEPYDLAFDYRIDCLTGEVQVMRTTAMNPNLSELFYIIENNPNDPNNLDVIGDVQVASAWFTPTSQGWHTIPFNLERGKNYYLKRGIWGPCMKWKELRKYNVEMQPDQFNANFNISVSCDNGDALLSVTGADQQGKNPLNMYSLYEHFPGTSQSAQLLESITWWQQSSGGGSNYQYQQGPFSFNTPLDPTKHYYVKRGVWDACTPWAEKRRYDVYGLVCPKNAMENSDNGVDNAQKSNFELFPNPVNNTLTIATDLEYDQFQLLTIGGKLIGTYTSTSINVSNLESGAYLLRFLKDENILSTERFIKK